MLRRACLFDLEPGIRNVIKASPMGVLFKFNCVLVHLVLVIIGMTYIKIIRNFTLQTYKTGQKVIMQLILFDVIQKDVIVHNDCN